MMELMMQMILMMMGTVSTTRWKSVIPTHQQISTIMITMGIMIVPSSLLEVRVGEIQETPDAGMTQVLQLYKHGRQV